MTLQVKAILIDDGPTATAWTHLGIRILASEKFGRSRFFPACSLPTLRLPLPTLRLSLPSFQLPLLMFKLPLHIRDLELDQS